MKSINFKRLLNLWRKRFLQKENEYVIYERVSKNNSFNGVLFDSVFMLIFFFLPIALASIKDLINNVDSNTLYIVNFTILALVYPIGIIVYWRSNHVLLMRNGSICFFIATIVFGLLMPLIEFILNRIVINPQTVFVASTITKDVIKVLILIFMLKVSFPLRLDLKYVLKKKTIDLLIITIIFVGLYFLLNPLFLYINELITNNRIPSFEKEIRNQIINKDLFRFWLLFTSISITPIFYSLIYHYSIMTLMRSEIGKFVVPSLFFIVVLLINNPIKQELTYFFFYLWWSIILTTILFIKRNATFTIMSNQLIGVISFLRLLFV